MIATRRTGERVGSYVIQDVLGHGAFGTTYKAVNVDTGEWVVLKFPDPSYLGDPAVSERFRRELMIGERLSHPHIQRAVATGEDADGPYLVLEYAEGVSLRSHLSARGPLPSEEALAIACQLADALEYAHHLGIYHRDLKPENIVISDTGHVRIVDFGIALLKGARRITWGFVPTAMGTPDYMAPEQVQGKRGDARTDIYALGILLYEMVTGVVPFSGDNPLAVLNQHLNASPKPPHLLRPAVPKSVSAIILRAIRKDPDARYQDAVAMLREMRQPDQVSINPSAFQDDAVAETPDSGESNRGSVLLVGGIIGFAMCAVLAVVILMIMQGR